MGLGAGEKDMTFADYILSRHKMSTEVVSVRVRKDLKARMRTLPGVRWQEEVEAFLERRVKEEEQRAAMAEVAAALVGVKPSEEPAWKAIRDARAGRT